MKISVCIITRNEERPLGRCLASVAPLADEIVVVDSGSTDSTRAVAEKFGGRFIPHAWTGYVDQKNFALSQATYPWVLSIDADEELSSELREAILRLKNAAGSGISAAPNGYRVSRLVFYRGRWIRHGDWYPDRLVRLFRRDEALFTGGRVHEKLELRGEHPILPGHLHHFTYENAADRTARCAHYAELWAQTAHEKKRQVAPWSGPLHALVRLVRGFLLKGGFLDGAVGWDIALGNAREVWLKYHLLEKLNREPAEK